MTQEVPLIHTSKGNLPLAELEYQVSWEETPENVIWVGEHFHKKPYGEGESVRREVHIYIKRGISMTAEQNEVQNG